MTKFLRLLPERRLCRVCAFEDQLSYNGSSSARFSCCISAVGAEQKRRALHHAACPLRLYQGAGHRLDPTTHRRSGRRCARSSPVYKHTRTAGIHPMSRWRKAERHERERQGSKDACFVLGLVTQECAEDG
ncbi:uncharacterized protein LOC133415156 isoform X2 [Phycodurus eques]|uniref:uncharacterized protein LOC133415156 isoform X2 n=1 Tax=Phycodurus eques TaxID=693459 RepID=UPI002ACE4FDA|nr:uncharacterized protein LOC133415156 isoform X2 [Phycodurus eques]